MPSSPIKINTSFLFKKKSSVSSVSQKNRSSSEEGYAKNKENNSPSTFSELLNKRKNKRTNSKNSSDQDIDDASSDESLFDEKKSPISSPDFFKRKDPFPPPDCEALRLRQHNIKERDAFLASFMNDPEFAEAVKHVGLFQGNDKPSSTKNKPVKRGKKRDENFRTTCQIPLERRTSLRLQEKTPQFGYKDLPDESSFVPLRKRKYNSSDDDLENLEEVVYKPKTKRKSTQRSSERTSFLYVEDVTDSMIKNVARKVVQKVYSVDSGSSCHQCRQKTKDTKTFCRSQDCIGLRGQFCGVCLLNRYGEDAAVALKDPNWHCPVCRGICNCSFCRARAGKRPTGILVPLAHKAGHKSVKEFLDSLRGRGDYVDPYQDPKKLLGFSKDLQFAQMGGDHKEYIGTSVYFTKMKEIIELFEKKLLRNVERQSAMNGDFTDSTQDAELVLGFTKDLDYAVMGNGLEDYIGSHSLSYRR